MNGAGFRPLGGLALIMARRVRKSGGGSRQPLVPDNKSDRFAQRQLSDQLHLLGAGLLEMLDHVGRHRRGTNDTLHDHAANAGMQSRYALLI